MNEYREFVLALGAVVVAVYVTAKLMKLRKDAEVADEAVAGVRPDSTRLRVWLGAGFDDVIGAPVEGDEQRAILCYGSHGIELWSIPGGESLLLRPWSELSDVYVGSVARPGGRVFQGLVCVFADDSELRLALPGGARGKVLARTLAHFETEIPEVA